MKITAPDNWVKGNGAMLSYIPIPSTFASETNFFQTTLPFRFTLITNRATPTTGDPDPYYYIETMGRNLFAFQVSVQSGQTFTGEVDIDGTLDGTEWFNIGKITQAGITQYSGLYSALRASIPTLTSGTVTVKAMMQRT